MYFQKSILLVILFVFGITTACKSKITEKSDLKKISSAASGSRIPGPFSLPPSIPAGDLEQAPCYLPGGGTLALNASQTRSAYASGVQLNCANRVDQVRTCSLENKVATLSGWSPSSGTEECIKTSAQRTLYRYSDQGCALSANQKTDQSRCNLNGVCQYDSAISPSILIEYPHLSCSEANAGGGGGGGGFCSGSEGTSATNPCVVNQLSDLLSIKSISQAGSKVHFKLGADIALERAALLSSGLSDASVSWASECQEKTLSGSGLRLPSDGILGSQVKSFDGANKSILFNGVNFRCSTSGDCGVLFGQLTDAQVKDLTLKPSSVASEILLQSETSNPSVGFLVGSATDSKFTNIHAERLKVMGDSNQGALGVIAGRVNTVNSCSELRGIVAKDLSVEVKGMQGNVVAGGVVGVWSGSESCRTNEGIVELRAESYSQAVYRDSYFTVPLDPKQRVMACAQGVNVTLGGLIGSVSKLRLGRSLLVQMEEKANGFSGQFDRNRIVHNKALGTETGSVEKGLNVGAGIFFGAGSEIDVAFNPATSGVNFFGTYLKGTYNSGAVFGRLTLRHYEQGLLTANLSDKAAPESPCAITNLAECAKYGIGIGYVNVRGFSRVGGFAGRVEAVSDDRKVAGIMVLDSLIQSIEPPVSVGRNAAYAGGVIGQVVGPSAVEFLSSGGNAVVAEDRASGYNSNYETNIVTTIGAGGLIGAMSSGGFGSSCSIVQSRTFEGFGYLSFPGSPASLKSEALVSNYAGSQRGSVAMATGKQVGGLVGLVECPRFVANTNAVRFLNHVSGCEQVGGSVGAIDSNSATVINVTVRNTLVRAMNCPMGAPTAQDSRGFRSGSNADFGGIVGFAKDLSFFMGSNVRNVEVAGEYGVGGLVGRAVNIASDGSVPSFRGNTVIRSSAIGSQQVGASYGALDVQVRQMDLADHSLAGNLAMGSRAVGGLVGYANASNQRGLRIDLNSIRIRSDRDSGTGPAFNYSAVSEAFRPVVAVRNDPGYMGLGGVIGGFGGIIGIGERLDLISDSVDVPSYVIESYLDYRNAHPYYLNALPGDLTYPIQNSEAQILSSQDQWKFQFVRRADSALWCPVDRNPKVLSESRVPADAECSRPSSIGRMSAYIEWMNGNGGQVMLRAIDGAGLISGVCSTCDFENLGLVPWNMSSTKLSVAPSRDVDLSSPARVTADWISSSWSTLFGRGASAALEGVAFPGVFDGAATHVNRRFHNTIQGMSYFLDIQTYSQASVVKAGRLEFLRTGVPQEGFVEDLEE